MRSKSLSVTRIQLLESQYVRIVPRSAQRILMILMIKIFNLKLRGLTFIECRLELSCLEPSHSEPSSKLSDPDSVVQIWSFGIHN